MNKMRYLLLTIPLLIGLMFTSCIDDDFSTSPHDLLTFSTDTITFDTVFTDLGTPTARLKVYNHAKKTINISHIRFKKDNSEFSFNVDGMSGKEFYDVEIRGGDSIYIFIECYIKSDNSNEPYLTEDKLEFITNGVTQSVQVEAYGQNVTRLHGITIDKDTHLTAERPYVVFDSIVVSPNAILTIEPGARILFHDKAYMHVYGSLEASGKQGNMIQLRGDRLDNVLPDVGYDIMAGQWGGIRFAPASFNNKMEYVDMRSTVFGISVDSCAVTERSKLLLINSWFHNSQSNVLSAKYANIDAYGCCFSEAADAVVALSGGNHRFVQCTIANNYLFSAIMNPLLCLYNAMPGTEASGQPLMKAVFENCIIYGLASDINIDDLSGSDVYLRNVLLKSEGSDDDHFIACIWGANPLFYTIREEYIFNYRLQIDSPAIGAGNAAFVSDMCRFDIDGNDRLSSGKPDIGAYVFKDN